MSKNSFGRLLISLLPVAILSSATGCATQNDSPEPASPIHAGQLVHVSEAHSDLGHNEVLVAADPTNAANLVACSYMDVPDPKFTSNFPGEIISYVSHDAGTTWQPSQAINIYGKNFNSDPACEFAADGSAYLMAFGGDAFNLNGFRWPLYRSRDGGRSWTFAGNLPTNVDREYITADTNERGGRVYMSGNGYKLPHGKEQMGIELLSSVDGFKSWIRAHAPVSPFAIFDSNGVVTPRGTFGVVIGQTASADAAHPLSLHPPAANAKLLFLASRDSGKSFSKPVVVDGGWYLRHLGAVAGVPSLAVDSTRGPFHGRIYAAWVDVRTGRAQIRFSRSTDDGKTWVPSFVISDNWPRDASLESPDAYMPMLAVNRNGVLGIVWYDRRDHPDNLGYDVRFSASLDGGESFVPSVLLARGGNSVLEARRPKISGIFNPFGFPSAQERTAGRIHSVFDWNVQDSGGDTVGLAADANGIFHPTWIDRRFGPQQISTARVTVEGNAAVNGGGALASLRDLSTETQVRYGVPYLDLKTNTISFPTVIANASKRWLPAHLKLRLLGFDAETGPVTALGTDNSVSAAGAIWNFVSASPAGLAPGAITAARTLSFRLARTPLPPSHVPYDPRSSVRPDLLEIVTKVLGR